MPVQRRVIYLLYQRLWAALDWFYPPNCAGCEASGNRWCLRCQKQLILLPLNVCECCGRPVRINGLCSLCKERRPEYNALRSWAFFGNPLRQAIHRLKYRRDLALGELFSRPLIELFESYNWQVDIVVPVPLSVARFTERGYNQSALLARPISIAKGIKYLPNALQRIRETRSQVDLSLEERWKNVDRAFKAIPKIVTGKKILLVDDVTTSGATMNACSTALKSAGAKSIYGLTLARTA